MTHFKRNLNGPRKSLGFTLIEAIVAITIIGVAAMPIMLLISQSLDQLTRVADANERAFAMESALAIIDPVNPLVTPTGSIEMGEIILNWSSETLVPPNKNVKIGTGLPGYSVGFYNVEMDLLKEGNPWFTFSTRKIGFAPVSTDSPFGPSVQ